MNTVEKLLPRCDFPLIPAPLRRLPFDWARVNAALAVKPFQSQVNAESAALPEGADLLIVAAPRDANLQAIILILNPNARANRLESVCQRKRVFSLVGQINHGRAEDRPIATEQHAR